MKKEHWVSSFNRWYGFSKEKLMRWKYQADRHCCGYCLDDRLSSAHACESCLLPPEICKDDGSTWHQFEKTDDDKKNSRLALIILRATVKHGRELSYVSGVQERKIKELEKLEKIMFGGES